jgi:hypothetical protein
MKGTGLANQQHRRRHRFGYFLFGRPIYPRRIERDAVSIAHGQTYPESQFGASAGKLRGSPVKAVSDWTTLQARDAQALKFAIDVLIKGAGCAAP